MEEALFLERVNSSLVDPSGNRASAPGSPSPPSKDHSDTSLTEAFTRELEAVGGVVYRVGTIEEARDTVRQIVVDRGMKPIVRTQNPFIEELDLDGALTGSGAEVTVCDLRSGISSGRIREVEFDADAGITSADYGLAETGTLALLAGPGQGRSVSLLPPVHVAILRTGDIVRDLSVFFERLKNEHPKLPSALTFITGPSRTADIELVLTVGVHGPKELHVVLLGGD